MRFQKNILMIFFFKSSIKKYVFCVIKILSMKNHFHPKGGPI